jgi:hypothetical protein
MPAALLICFGASKLTLAPRGTSAETGRDV